MARRWDYLEAKLDGVMTGNWWLVTEGKRTSDGSERNFTAFEVSCCDGKRENGGQTTISNRFNIFLHTPEDHLPDQRSRQSQRPFLNHLVQLASLVTQSSLKSDGFVTLVYCSHTPSMYLRLAILLRVLLSSVRPSEIYLSASIILEDMSLGSS